MGKTLCGILAASLVLPCALARADVVIIPASRDNTVFEDAPDRSNGAGDHIFAGQTDMNWLRRALLAFDVAGAIPPGSTITAVTLTLYLSRTKTNNKNVYLYRLLSDWGEGTSDASGEEGAGAPATTGDATWSHNFWQTSTWTTPGGDFVGTASAVTVVGSGTGFHTWSSAQMVVDAQSWLDAPAGNLGWIIIGDEAGTKVVKRFDSRTNPDVTRRPALEITYTPPAGNTGACCDAVGGCTVVEHPGGTCSGTYQGRDTTCSPNPCPAPSVACCYPTASAICLEETEADCLAAGGAPEPVGSSCTPNPCPVVLEPFVDPLPLPAVASPVSGAPGSTATYDMAIEQFAQQLHRDLPPTIVWGFDDGTGPSYPGPTIEAYENQPVTVNWINDLRDGAGNLRTSHYLPVDLCPHGAADNARTVIHLHGGHVEEAVDGHPEATFLPGNRVTYEYPNWQQAGTLWYHDHSLGVTRLNVYMGMAGFYLLRDPVESSLNLPSGPYEVPLAIQDRVFNPDGTLSYPAVWDQHFFGDTIVVNGKVWPYFNVDRGKYRFRLLSGSGSRTYTLALSDGATFWVIGTEGGLIEAPVPVTELTLSSGERTEVIIDFEPYAPGTEILLVNSAPAPYPGTPGVGVIPEIMKFVVQNQTGHTAAIPSTLATVVAIPESSSVITRNFDLQKASDACSGQVWLINGLHWGDITEFPQLGTTEIWRFTNLSGITHPMHMHLVFFQVLDRQPFTVVGGVPTAAGPAVPPPPEEVGWKDTVKVGPNEWVRVIASFDDFVGKYAYHCHILEHEDHEMMRQFQTVTECGDGARGLPIETCDDGDLDLTDSCPDGATGSCLSAFCGDGYTWSTDGGNEDCDDAGESSTCDADCTDVLCGDGELNTTAGEQCDDGDLDLTDACPDGPGGSCAMAACGDGFIWAGNEICDDGGESSTCDADCTAVLCGDGIANATAGEGCDDGDDILTDACPDGATGSCVDAFCGDGFIWSSDGGNETCDDAGESSTCDTDCTAVVCGDGVHNVTAGEGCDDGDADNSDACPDGVGGTCQSAFCGDGFTWSGNEICDDAGESSTCDSDCTAVVCGDGVRNATAGEGCDDGDDDNSDSCPDGVGGSCQSATCGDGHTWSADGGTEECDDGGDSETCDGDCTMALCGDGRQNTTAGEGCDDGDGDNSDSCPDGAGGSCVPAACDDGFIWNTDGGNETCDPISSCPTSCDDGNACTTDALTGSAAACTAACTHTPITACAHGDNCCPAGCNANDDDDCSPSCGNDVVEPGETCDLPAECPTDCSDGNSCTVDTLTGSAANCNAACAHTSITVCVNDDQCCPGACNALNDNDCSASCGNDVVEPGETCDLPSECPTSCGDGNACTIDSQTGSAANCNVACVHDPIVSCASGDGCCPSGCNATVDDDCSASCGNDVVEPGETCDLPAECPTRCSDGNSCTQDNLTGSAANCNVACQFEPIVSCVNGDGCCPDGCNATVDDDCSPACGNDVVEPGETCDLPAECPTSCDDGNSCTNDTRTGSAANCNVACSHESIVACEHGDGCCPVGCDVTVDDDCSSSCGNDVVEPGETCDLPAECPTTCDDGAACTNDVLTGSAENCNVACAHNAISTCGNGDGCCPAGCTATVDDDCSPTCGNGVVEAGETCDPVASCPTSCDDGAACTVDTLTGSADGCSAACSHNVITACAGGDGCCPAGCDSANDSDCSATCGNDTLETGETCDPPSTCPTGCDDGDACTADLLTGSAEACSAQCAFATITTCVAGDGCCPAGCTHVADEDCPAPSVPATVAPQPDGCGCRASESSGGPAVGMMLGLAVALRRRRRRLSS